MSIDPRLLEFCKTSEQRTKLEAVIKHGSSQKAAKALGVNRRTVDKAVNLVKGYAIKLGYSPEHQINRRVPDGLKLAGLSDMRTNEEGKPIWYKFSEDKERQQELMREAIEAMAEGLPRVKPVAAPKKVQGDLLNCYVITDYHLGALAWSDETHGDDWDIKIAEQLLVSWFAEAIRLAPEAEVGLFAQLGDMLHWDGIEAVTPTSKHILDADTRFAKLVRVAIRVIRRVIDMLLKKHKRVHVLMAEGNHDLASSIWLREWLAAIYENEPRITVDTNPDPYYCYEHGKTSIFFHHGHKRKLETLDEIFAAKFREVFGRTLYSYVHTGHLHHKLVKETGMMILEQHATLAAPDSHASRGGWMSKRMAQVITYHKQFGDVGRIGITPEMLKEAA